MAAVYTLTTSGGTKAGGVSLRTITAGATRVAWQNKFVNTSIWHRDAKGKLTRHQAGGLTTDDWNDKQVVTATETFVHGDDISTPEDILAQMGFHDDIETREYYRRVLNNYR
jgi:hypothetical protein